MNGKDVIPSTSDAMKINLKPINITQIVVYKIAKNYGETDNVTGESIAAEDTKTFALYAKAEEDPELGGKNAAFALGWTVNNAKSATDVKDETSGSIIGIKKGSPTITVCGSTMVNGKYKATKVTLKASVTQPSTTIQLTTKNKAAYANQTVSFNARLEKGSSTKAKDLEWTVTDLSDNNKKSSFTNGKLKITYPIGHQHMIRVRVKETGASASMKMWVVNKTTSVVINDKDGKKGKALTVTISGITLGNDVAISPFSIR